VRRWAALSYGHLVSELRDLQAYELEFDSKKYQIEVELLENAGEDLTVMVSVDDGSLSASIGPATHIFMRQKTGRNILGCHQRRQMFNATSSACLFDKTSPKRSCLFLKRSSAFRK